MIILFGPAGSGKGTQGQILAELFGWRWLSVGEVIRASHHYDPIINRGELVPDEDVIHLMHDEIANCFAAGKDVILDGYPRDEIQADYVVRHYASRIHGAIVLEVPKDQLYERLAIRGRTDDQKRTAIDKRFSVFEQNICSILQLLEARNIPVRRADGTGTVEGVTERLIRIVHELNPELSSSPEPRAHPAPSNNPNPKENHD